MNESNVQFIEKNGDPQYVVMPIENYREIVSLLNDIEDYSAIDQALIEYRAGETVPSEVLSAILNGDSPLRAWRECRGYTLDSLAKRIGVSKGYLSQIENGRKSGSLDLFRQVSIELNVTIDDLVNWGEERPSVESDTS